LGEVLSWPCRPLRRERQEGDRNRPREGSVATSVFSQSVLTEESRRPGFAQSFFPNRCRKASTLSTTEASRGGTPRRQVLKPASCKPRRASAPLMRRD